MSKRKEDETDFSFKALSRGGVKQSGGKPKSDKTNVSPSKGHITADAVPSDNKFHDDQESASETGSATDEYSYNLNGIKRGTCIVFNNVQFDERTGQRIRKGSDLDAQKVKETFQMFGLDVRTYEDCTCLQMWDVMKNESNRNHSDEDCFVCVVLSHGTRWLDGEKGGALLEKDIIYGKDNFMALKDITQHVNETNCPSLAGKPKIFIIQACRGDNVSEAVEFAEVTGSFGETEIRPSERKRVASYHEMSGMDVGYDVADAVPSGAMTSVPQDIPIDVDYVLVYSSPPGFFSFRSSEKGSFFITAVCEQLRRWYKHKDLMTILTRVNHQVAFLYESFAPSSRGNPDRRDIHEKKQMPWVASQLTKFVYFRDKQ